MYRRRLCQHQTSIFVLFDKMRTWSHLVGRMPVEFWSAALSYYFSLDVYLESARGEPGDMQGLR
jgi:hypothetical protein